MDHSAFTALAERHRRELHVHCYRMLASFDEAEDAVQETFLKAWRGRAGFDGSAQFRAWLYRIATNVCLDMLRRGSRRPSGGSLAEVPWLQPYPDPLLDAAAPGEDEAAYHHDGVPHWQSSEVLHVKPGPGFAAEVEKRLSEMQKSSAAAALAEVAKRWQEIDGDPAKARADYRRTLGLQP